MMKRLAGNLLFAASNWRHHRAYRQAAGSPREHQELLLRSFLRRNARAAYGLEHGYERIRSVREYQERVPIVTYEDLEPWIERIRRGERGVLTTEPVLAFEKTSGSAGAAKYIPYTASLLREFRCSIGAWLFDLFRHKRGLLAGAHYWSLSPLARDREAELGGPPVGFQSDAEYFGPIERRWLRWLMAVPGEVAAARDIEECWRLTLDNLVGCHDLRFVSVWNPSFLTLLLKRLPPEVEARALWPDLELISCWTSGAAARFLPELRALLPGVEIQGKGLMATEGVFSFPLVGRPGAAPAITSHFLEFLDEDGRALLVDELEVGARYRPLLTTGGGFARYDVGDLVEVVAPGAIEFVGRAGAVSDVCGEKLTEAFVGRVLEAAAQRASVSGLLMLAPEWGSPPHYLVFAERDPGERFAADIDRALRSSPQYDYCRRLGQLGQVELVVVEDGEERFVQGCLAEGQRAGDVKSAYLRRELGWREHLTRGSSLVAAEQGANA